VQVREQFLQRPGIMTYQEKPDYNRCVSMVAASALREMIKPGLLAVCSPVAIGLTFRAIGRVTGQELLGAKVGCRISITNPARYRVSITIGDIVGGGLVPDVCDDDQNHNGAVHKMFTECSLNVH
jgi:hypothetical protein